jgi:hypothetical protein
MREDGMSSTAVTSPAPGPAAGNQAPAPPRVGTFPPAGLLERGPETTRAFLVQAAGAGILVPYAEAGCAEFNLIPQSPDPDQAIAGAAAVKKLLARA